MTSRSFLRALTGIGAAILVAGCSTGTGQQPTGMAVPAIGIAPSAPTSFMAALAGLPWMAYSQNPAQSQVAQQAQLILAVRCMHGKGFKSFTQSLIPYAMPDLAYEPGGPYGWINKQKAAEYGFHESPADSADAHLLATRLPTAEGDVLHTCLASASTALQGGRAIDPEGIVNHLAGQAWNLTSQDSRVRNATRQWSACMRAHGFHYPAPPTQQSWLGKSRAASPAEIAVAVADANCTALSDLAGIFFAVDAGYQRELIHQDLSALTPIQAEIRAEDARDAAVVAGTTATHG